MLLVSILQRGIPEGKSPQTTPVKGQNRPVFKGQNRPVFKGQNCPVFKGQNCPVFKGQNDRF
jgi:hypothetical protein